MKLREARLRKMLTIRALAEQANVSTATLLALEKGRRSARLDVMRKLCSALEVGPEDIDEFEAAIKKEAA